MFRKFGFFLLASFTVLAAVISVSAQLSIHGEVIDVIDGKTVVVATQTGKYKVELQYIDVPGPGHAMYVMVQNHLRDLLIGKKVTYQPLQIFGDRVMGRLIANNTDTSQQMLRDGAAWKTRPEVTGQEKNEYDIYTATEAVAKNERIGIWADPKFALSGATRAAKTENASKQERSPSSSNKGITSTEKPRTTPAKNPALGNVGALLNDYDPKTRTGYVRIPLSGVSEVDRGVPIEYRTAIAITYYYAEDEKKGRKGIFVVDVVSIAKQWRFLTRNDLTVVGGGKNILIGKPKRTTSRDGDTLTERLAYQLDRSTIERVVNGGDVLLKIGGYAIQPSDGLKFLLYNMLQVSE